MATDKTVEDKEIQATVRGLKKIIKTAKEMAREQNRWPDLELEPEGWLALEEVLDTLMVRTGLSEPLPNDEGNSKPFRLCRRCTVGAMTVAGKVGDTEILQCNKCQAVETGAPK